ncbi:MAG: glutathione-regulated potassium-efflux system protein KefC [Gammaproteobacteria bacterium]|nr:glutathione-regulated potassium-efflux system protein KefC [Gammaproteobacteria bacterium]MBU1653786.1 glutathione-regulated potassium-efflux system protein KefC [Gammaproteobacteria bacterium]MBU1961699.1 glutathione-regulated potassium-efflux system protein KefC [Gammaproteobacteria bacterium]
MDEYRLLLNAILYLAATVIMVPLAKRLGLGSVLGYLGAGAVIGPWGLGLVNDVEHSRHFAEFGVVLLLFVIGLELNPKRLWSMRHAILGLGASQVALSSLLLGAILLALGFGFNAALVVAMGLSLSSTAIALQSLKERNLLATQAGSSSFAILLFQDLAVIPMLALLPLLGVPAGGWSGNPWLGALSAVAVIIAIILGGRYLTRPIFRYIAATRLREVFTAFTLLLVFGIALLMAAVGMSMALGAFLAGVLLAESEYRHELEVEIEPFKGLLMGLFFISVGMSIDFGLLRQDLFSLLALVALLVSAKGAVLLGLSRFSAIPRSQNSLFVFLLAQGGEFAFVIFEVAGGSGLLDAATTARLVVVVALSMIATPLLLLLYDHLIAPRHLRLDQPGEPEAIDARGNPVIIVGFGRFGRTLGRLLHANGVPTTILDHDPDQIEAVRRFGYKVYFGDASRHDILEAAGAAEARLLVVAFDDAELALRVIDQARKHFPHLRILSRAENNGHAYELLRRGVTLFQREYFASALELGEDALKELGFGAYRAKQAANIFKDHDRALLHELYRLETAEMRHRISLKAREELIQLLAADEEEIAHRHREGWE